jgi:hypothetical protein
MIDRLVDKAVASLLETISGLSVFVGAEDNEPQLQTPFCVVWSNVTAVSGREPVYSLETQIEYNSISGQDPIATTENIMSQIDALISPGGNYSGQAGIVTAGLKYLAWESLARSQESVGDRRKNMRALLVHAQMT